MRETHIELPPNTWIVKGDLRGFLRQDTGLFVSVKEEGTDTARDFCVHEGACFSLGGNLGDRDTTADELLRLWGEGQLAYERVWLGVDLEGAWAVVVHPHDPYGAIAAWMN